MRIAVLERADMDAEQARVYDAAKASTGIVGGPFQAYIQIPRLYEAVQGVIGSVTPDPISLRERTVINLVVARHWGARYPWSAQVRHARAAGIGQDVVDAINARKTPRLADPRERTCYEVTHQLVTDGQLSDAVYQAAEKLMGLKDLVALVASIGTFAMTCLTANAFGLEPPADAPTPLAR